MDHIDRMESPLAAPDHAAGRDESIGTDGTQTFRVRYVIKPHGRQSLLTALSHALGMRGELCFAGPHITLGPAGHARPRQLPSADLFDIRLAGLRLSFDVHASNSETERVTVKARDQTDLRRILELLPVRMTPAYAAERLALTTFKSKLATVTPLPWATYLLIALNVAVFLAMCAAGVGVLKPDFLATIGWGTNFGAYTLDDEPWRVLTSMFIHFGLFHLVSNMVVLYALGRLTERLYGNLRFLALYVFAGLAGSITSLLVHPGLNSAGASGAIYGVAGALLIYVLRFRRELPAAIATRQRNIMIAYLVISLWDASQSRNIDNAAHLGGLAGGLLIGALLARPLEKAARQQTSFHSALASWLVACGALAASLYPLTHFSQHTLAELRFSRMRAELVPAQRKVIADEFEWRHQPIRSQPEKDVASNQALVKIVPEWDALYARVDQTGLPAGSTHSALRQAMLRYFDDNRQIVRRAALLLSHDQDHDEAALAPIHALRDDAIAQTALMKKLIAADSQGRR